LNPAVAVGLSINKAQAVSPANGIVAILGEVFGALLAAALHRIVHPQEYSEEGDAEFGKLQKLVAESVGTFYLVMTVTMNVLSAQIFAAWSIAASLACMVYCFAEVSGANFNPAVTLGCMVKGATSANDGCMYILAQIKGGILGAMLAVSMFPHQNAALAIGSDYNVYQAMGSEFIYTFLLVFVVLNIATVGGKSVGDFAGLAVGSCITAGGYAAGRISGGCFNPAVAIGLAVAGVLTRNSEQMGRNTVLYILMELLAGVTAAFVIKLLRPSEQTPEEAAEAAVEDDEEKQALLNKDPKVAEAAASTESGKEQTKEEDKKKDT